MKTTTLSTFVMLVTLAGCGSSSPVLVPKSPHGGVLFSIPETKRSVEIVRQDLPENPGKVQIVAYFLDDQLKPMEPSPSAVMFQPKTPRNAPKVELKPSADPDPAKASSLTSASIDNTGEVAGELSATIDGKSLTLPISVR